MKVLFISGSVREESSNVRLLKYLDSLMEGTNSRFVDYLHELAVFNPDRNIQNSDFLHNWREDVVWADLVIISTPEYIHNIPAMLKNAFEWLTASGEFDQKKVIVFTYTPHKPRGTYAMNSLIPTLQALNCNILLQEKLYQSELLIDENLNIESDEFGTGFKDFIANL